MKFVKSSIFKKIVIILIILILFNALVPKEVKAWDVAGILMKPLTSIVLVIMVSIDATLGVFLTATDMLLTGIGTVISDLCDPNTGSTIADKLLVGPDTIFTGQVGILNANIFKASVNTTGIIQNSNVIGSIKEGLAETYVVLRNVCAILMLAGLIFTGIRILVSSNLPNKKAAWLGYLQDWLIGIVLLIFSHIIMIGIFYISDTLVNALRSSMVGASGNLNWELVKQCFESFDSAEEIVCLVMLGYLIYLTVVFAVAYFKRLMWVCVLIVIAPIVSIMYAFGNGTKQIYGKWLREFIMTVLVQPFHMIIYYTLFSVPLNMTGSNGFTLTGSNIFTLIYALGAISFIRPAEKYVRELFGMHQGIASMASFDSGKQTMDAIVDSVKEAFSKIAMVAAIAATGGAAAAAAPAMGAAAGAGGAAAAEGAGATAVLGTGEGTAGTLEGMNLLGSPESSLIDAGLSGPTDPILEQYSSEGFGQNDNGEYFDPWTGEYDANYDPHKDLSYNPDYNPELEEKTTNNEMIDSTDEATQKLKEEQINAANVTITAGNVNMEGRLDGKEIGENLGEDLEDKIEEALEEEENRDDEDSLEIEQGKKDKSRILNPVNPLSEFMKVATGQKGLIDAMGSVSPRAMENQFGEKLKTFEDIGGMKSLHKGFNEIRDTFYVSAPPSDWKKSDERMNTSQKERQEQIKFNVVNNKGAQNYIINQEKYMEKLRAQYPDEQKYPDAYLQNLAEEKAKSKLKSLSDTYVPLGIQNAEVMYSLDKDRKKYGLTAEEAIQQRASFERFNTNKDNIIKVNIENKQDVHMVSDAIPNARDYYNNGYNNAKDMLLVRAIEQKLKVTPDYAMQIDKVLKRKGGKLNYKGDNGEIKDIVKQINEQYKGD